MRTVLAQHQLHLRNRVGRPTVSLQPIPLHSFLITDAYASEGDLKRLLANTYIRINTHLCRILKGMGLWGNRIARSAPCRRHRSPHHTCVKVILKGS